MKRDRHAMISRAGGNHAAAGVFGREGQESVQRAPLFERTGQLQVFELEKYLTAGHSADRFRVSERREMKVNRETPHSTHAVGAGYRQNYLVEMVKVGLGKIFLGRL